MAKTLKLINMKGNRYIMSTSNKIGFIGCGKMASAIIKGVLQSGFVSSDKVIASEVDENFAQMQRQSLGIEVVVDNNYVAKNSDVIFIATKPHFVQDVLSQIKPEINNSKLIVSIAAGVSTKKIEEVIGEIPVIRVMPNAPAVILEGMSGVVKGKYADDAQIDFIVQLLSKIGKCIVVDENKIDALTAISGSGPAFFYKIFHEMALAGERLGLEYQKSLELAIQTAIGSAKLMQESNMSAEELISAVATKGGCTAVGVDYLNQINSQDIFYNLIQKTAEKSKSLG